MAELSKKNLPLQFDQKVKVQLFQLFLYDPYKHFLLSPNIQIKESDTQKTKLCYFYIQPCVHIVCYNSLKLCHLKTTLQLISESSLNGNVNKATRVTKWLFPCFQPIHYQTPIHYNNRLNIFNKLSKIQVMQIQAISGQYRTNVRALEDRNIIS